MEHARIAWLLCGWLLSGFLAELTERSYAGDGLETIKARGSLVWGADEEGGGPFVYPSPDDPGKRVGFEVELAEVIARHLGVRAEFAQGQWDKLPDLLDRGDIDVVLNGYEWTASRAERYGTSIPYYIYELQLVTRRDDTTLRSWEDLRSSGNGRKKRLAVLGGAAAQDYLEQQYPNDVEIVVYDGVTDALRGVELSIDGVDANLQDSPIWGFYQKGFPALHAIDHPVGRGYYVALVRKGEPELLQAVNAAILNALHDGTLQKICSRYGMWNSAQAERGLSTDKQGNFTGGVLHEGVNLDGGTEDLAIAEYAAVRGWRVIRDRGWLLVQAALVTVGLAIVSMPLAVIVGLALALVRLYGPKFLGRLAIGYIEIIRGTPLVLQLYVIFFLLPEIGISFHAFWAGVIGLAMNYSAYEAEIYRAGLQAIPKGQMEAALSLGMSRRLALRRIIVPQATRLVIPAVTNDFIALFKDTAVCSVITVVELSKEYYIQARSTGAIVELGLLTAILYFGMSYPLSRLAARLERNLQQDERK